MTNVVTGKERVKINVHVMNLILFSLFVLLSSSRLLYFYISLTMKKPFFKEDSIQPTQFHSIKLESIEVGWSRILYRIDEPWLI